MIIRPFVWCSIENSNLLSGARKLLLQHVDAVHGDLWAEYLSLFPVPYFIQLSQVFGRTLSSPLFEIRGGLAAEFIPCLCFILFVNLFPSQAVNILELRHRLFFRTCTYLKVNISPFWFVIVFILSPISCSSSEIAFAAWLSTLVRVTNTDLLILKT
jgi:hypothetical protein